MNRIIADRLAKALESRRNDPNNFIWRGAKKYVNGKAEQEEVKLMDATPEQLKRFYKHCQSMLYSTDKENPGRYTLLNIIDDQQDRCNAELYIRELRNPSDKSKAAFPIHIFYKQLREALDLKKNEVPQSTWNKAPIGSIILTPEDFSTIPINIVLDACLSNLGRFKKKHITLNFLLNQGLWFTKDEIKEYLTMRDEAGNLIPKLDVVRYNLDLQPNISLKTNYNGGLTYCEFRAMYNLHDMLYSEMTSLQLQTLRDKILFRLANEVRDHAKLWEEKISQIQKVCELRNINLSD